MKNTLVKVILGLFIGLLCQASLLISMTEAASDLPIVEGVGGDFLLDASTGKKMSLQDFRGKAVLLFFGYTNCPDICPLTTAHMSSLMSDLGEKSNQVQVLFVTIDPESDTPEVLKNFLHYFDDRFIGLTGTHEEIDHIVALFKAEYAQVTNVPLPLDIKVVQRTGIEEGFIFSHTAQIYLLDTKGQMRAFFYIGSPIENMKKAILSIL